jgi:hypothetical protein
MFLFYSSGMNSDEVNFTHMRTLFHLPVVLCMVNCFKEKWVSVSKFCVSIVLKQPGPCWLDIAHQTYFWAYIWISYKTSTFVKLLQNINVNTILLLHNFCMEFGTNSVNIPHRMLCEVSQFSKWLLIGWIFQFETDFPLHHNTGSLLWLPAAHCTRAWNWSLTHIKSWDEEYVAFYLLSPYMLSWHGA